MCLQLKAQREVKRKVSSTDLRWKGHYEKAQFLMLNESCKQYLCKYYEQKLTQQHNLGKKLLSFD